MNDARINEAETLYDEVVNISETMPDLESSYSISAFAGFLQIYMDQGKMAKTLLLCEEIIEIQKHLYGSGTFEVNRAFAHLTACYVETLDFEKAQALYKEVIPHFIKAFDLTHEETVDLISRLTIAYSSMDSSQMRQSYLSSCCKSPKGPSDWKIFKHLV